MNSPPKLTYGLVGAYRTGLPWHTSYNNVINVVQLTGLKSGNDDRDYKAKIAKRIDVSHSYQRYETTLYKSGCQEHVCEYKYSDGKWYPYITRQYVSPSPCPYGPGQFPSVPEVTIANDLALKRLKRKLLNDTQQFQLALPLAEVKELRSTLHGVAYSATNMLKALVSLKHGNLRDAHRRASDVWLTWSFGVSPMLSDAESISAAIATYLARGYRSARYSGQDSAFWLTSGSFSSNDDGFYNIADAIEYYHEYHVRYIAGYQFLIQAANNYGLQDQFRLGAENLPSLAWELIPFSWVVDYFTTMGAYLDDAFYTPPGNTTYVIQNQLYKCKVNPYRTIKKSVLFNTYPSRGHVIDGSNPESEYFHFRRTPLSSLPRRQCRFKTYDEITANLFNRVLNLASLLGGGRPSTKSKIPIF